MAEQTVVGELFAQTYIRKFLLKKLDPKRMGTEPFALELSADLAAFFTFRLQVSTDVLIDPTISKGRIPLVISRPSHQSIDPHLHQQIMKRVHDLFMHEFHTTVTRMHLHLNVPRADAFQYFRDLYDIEEEDWSEKTMEQNYLRYARKHHRGSLRPGRPRKARPKRPPHWYRGAKDPGTYMPVGSRQPHPDNKPLPG